LIAKSRIALNRIAAPSLGLADFYEFAASLGIGKVELRNDIGGKDPIDGMSAGDAARLASDRGVEVISINALQKFNLASDRPKALDELKALVEMAAGIGCKAIVLCPNNDSADVRSPELRLSETVDSLVAFAPLFRASGLLGYIEPLGFGISSLASLLAAQEAIDKSGHDSYRVLYDTFHHYIGPDDAATLGGPYRVALTGLVHISGVEASIPREAYGDKHRVLVGPADIMKSREQMRVLERLGYEGDYSFEPFSRDVQKLGKRELGSAIGKSLDFVVA